MTNRGLAIYFHDERIRIFNKTIEDLGNPKYIHIYIKEKEKQLFIRRSDTRDNDTFRINYSKLDGEWRYRISSRQFVEYLAGVIGVPFPSESLWFDGVLLQDGQTVFVDLAQYHVVEYKQEQ